MEISVNTAQNVKIAYKSAGLANRLFATFIDLALIGAVAILIAMFLGIMASIGLNARLISIPLFTLLTSYHLLCEIFLNGRSIGKMLLNLRVVRLDGHKLTFWNCLLRWVFRLVDITLTSGTAAIISIIASSREQRLGDLAAGTIVINEYKYTSLQNISRYDTPEDYQVVFSQANLLSDKDIMVVREVLKEVEKYRNYNLLNPLASKIKELTGIQTNMVNLEFIKTIIQDYTHLAKQ